MGIAAHPINANTIYIAAAGGGVWKTTDGGSIWIPLTDSQPTLAMGAIASAPSNPSVIYAGTGEANNSSDSHFGGGILVSTDGGDGGMAKFSPTQPSRVYHVSPFASGETRFFRRSDDGGSQWTSKTSGLVYPSGFTFYPPFVVDPGNGDRVLLGGDRIYQTINGGDTWTALSSANENGWSPSGIVTAIGLSRTDANTIYAAVGRRVYVTTNHGLTWTSQTIATTGMISDLQVDPEAPGTAYATIDGSNPNGNVAGTTDAGATWRYLPILGIGTSLKSVAPLPVRSLQIAPGGTLYVGAEDGVYSLDRGIVATCNTGLSSPRCAWIPVGTGLPRVQVSQIESHAALGILAAGTYGRGMWQIALPTEPVLGISLTHGAGFLPGMPGATYTISVKNSGTGPTTAPVTVATVLAPEFTAVSIAGTGWQCVQPAGPCSRSGALANGSAFPAITLTVNIGSAISPQVVSHALVTGGGAPDASASDTAILCAYAISPGGYLIAAAGGTVTVNVTAPAGCGWSVVHSASWITAAGGTAGSGGGAVTLKVEANAVLPRSATVLMAGLPFRIEQQAAVIPGLNLQGSMPHVAAQGNWSTTFTLVNPNPAPSVARFSMFDDGGNPLVLPLNLPGVAGPLSGSSLDRTLDANASTVITTAEPGAQPGKTGSAQLSADGAMTGFAIFSFQPTQQEAVVPLDSRTSDSYMLPFDHSDGIALGVSIANLTTRTESVAVIIRDDGGARIETGSLPLTANAHHAFVLSEQFPVTAGKRGTVEVSLAAGARVHALGVRYTPPGTLTTIPVLANVTAGTGSIAHLAVASGWKTTFVLVNTTNSPAGAHLKCFNDTGGPLALPLFFPQPNAGSPATASTFDRILPSKSVLLIESTGSDTAPLLNGLGAVFIHGRRHGLRHLPLPAEWPGGRGSA